MSDFCASLHCGQADDASIESSMQAIYSLRRELTDDEINLILADKVRVRKNLASAKYRRHRYATDPAYREAELSRVRSSREARNRRQRERYHNDTEYREHRKALSLAAHHRRRAADA